MFAFRKHRILNLFHAPEMSRSFGGLYFTRRNHINSKLQLSIVEFPVFQLLKFRIQLFGKPWKSARLVIESTRRPAVVFSLRVVCPCGRTMSGIVKVIGSFFSEKVKRWVEAGFRCNSGQGSSKGVSELK